MENLKFRAWDKRTKLMNDVTTIDLEGEVVFYHHWRYGHSKDISFKDVKLLQSTGLKDKSGVEIFEGDVVKHDPMPNPFFGNTNFEIVQVRTGEWRIDSIRGGSVLAFHNHQVEIIGNKYENPYLLRE